MSSTQNLKVVDALELTRNNYRDYGLYVGGGRAYSSIFDGCKSAYKRAIYGMWKDAPRKVSTSSTARRCSSNKRHTKPKPMSAVKGAHPFYKQTTTIT